MYAVNFSILDEKTKVCNNKKNQKQKSIYIQAKKCKQSKIKYKNRVNKNINEIKEGNSFRNRKK